MIDIHCHCLPGLDDGPASLDEAEALCRAAAADGCQQIVATPHQRLGHWWNGDPEQIEAARLVLESRLDGLLQVHLGAEIRIDASLLNDLDTPNRAGLLTLAGSDFMLVEFPRAGPMIDPEEFVHELRLAGFTPILAHPELIHVLGSDLDLLGRLTEMGAAIQITAMSLLGHFGRRPRALAEALLDEDLVHFVASDAHDTNRRPPGLSAAADRIQGRWGTRRAQRLTYENPERVLLNLPITESIAEPEPLRSVPS